MDTVIPANLENTNSLFGYFVQFKGIGGGGGGIIEDVTSSAQTGDSLITLLAFMLLIAIFFTGVYFMLKLQDKKIKSSAVTNTLTFSKYFALAITALATLSTIFCTITFALGIPIAHADTDVNQPNTTTYGATSDVVNGCVNLDNGEITVDDYFISLSDTSDTSLITAMQVSLLSDFRAIENGTWSLYLNDVEISSAKLNSMQSMDFYEIYEKDYKVTLKISGLNLDEAKMLADNVALYVNIFGEVGADWANIEKVPTQINFSYASTIIKDSAEFNKRMANNGWTINIIEEDGCSYVQDFPINTPTASFLDKITQMFDDGILACKDPELKLMGYDSDFMNNRGFPKFVMPFFGGEYLNFYLRYPRTDIKYDIFLNGGHLTEEGWAFVNSHPEWEYDASFNTLKGILSEPEYTIEKIVEVLLPKYFYQEGFQFDGFGINHGLLSHDYIIRTREIDGNNIINWSPITVCVQGKVIDVNDNSISRAEVFYKSSSKMNKYDRSIFTNQNGEYTFLVPKGDNGLFHAQQDFSGSKVTSPTYEITNASSQQMPDIKMQASSVICINVDQEYGWESYNLIFSATDSQGNNVQFTNNTNNEQWMVGAKNKAPDCDFIIYVYPNLTGTLTLNHEFYKYQSKNVTSPSAGSFSNVYKFENTGHTQDRAKIHGQINATYIDGTVVPWSNHEVWLEYDYEEELEISTTTDSNGYYTMNVPAYILFYVKTDRSPNNLARNNRSEAYKLAPGDDVEISFTFDLKIIEESNNNYEVAQSTILNDETEIAQPEVIEPNPESSETQNNEDLEPTTEIFDNINWDFTWANIFGFLILLLI